MTATRIYQMTSPRSNWKQLGRVSGLLLLSATLLSACVADPSASSSSALVSVSSVAVSEAASSSLPVPSSSAVSSSVPSSSSLAVSSVAISSQAASSVPSVKLHASCPGVIDEGYQRLYAEVPARIEAEHYNPDGFEDSTPENQGEALRLDEAVDIVDFDGGYAVGYMTGGEWLEYNIYVEQAGEYDLTMRFGTVDPDRTFSVSQCGTVLLDDIKVPRVADWDEAKIWNVGKVQLGEGLQKIRLTVTGPDYQNIDWFHIGQYDGPIDEPDATCALPSRFEWESSGELLGPRPGSGWASAKDPSVVFYDNKYHIFATYFQDSWKSFYTNFADWGQANNASQTSFSGTRVGNMVAPQIFYFEPQGLWYTISQWAYPFNAFYATTNDIGNPNSWTAPKELLKNVPEGSLDFWVICDDTHCHLFFSRDDGVLYKAKTTIANFPNFTYSESTGIVMREPRAGDLFEAANVYKVDGQDLYLLLVEAMINGNERYFRSWTAPTLDGPWTALADTYNNPFAGNANVSWPTGKWSSQGISHGEMVRSGFDQRLTIDPCNLEYVFQAESVNATAIGSGYGNLPYRLGKLKLKQ